MRFGFLSGLFYPEPGGPSTFLHHFLPEVRRAGHDAHVVAFGETRPEDAALDYRVTRISRRQGRIRRNWVYLQTARKLAADSDALFVVGYALLFLPFLRRPARRLVAKVVGDWSWEMADRRGLTTLDKNAFQTGPKHPLVQVLRAYYLWAVRHADLVITPSADMRRIVIGWGVAPERVRVVYNAIPAPQLMTTDRVELRRMLGLPTDQPLIVSVARLTPVKGVHVMLQALADVPGAHFVVVGDGPQQAELEAAAPAGRVTFVGAQPHERVLMYLRAADVYVLSSFTEGLSHTLLESIAVGAPAVASAVGGNPEVITDGVEGLLVPPGDPTALAAAVRRILDDPALARQMEAAGLARSQSFRWETEVAETLAALAEG